MKWIPERTPRNLLRILGYYTVLLYAALLLCHAFFRSGFTPRSLAGLVSLSAVAAMTAALGFWLEKKLFFFIFTLGLVFGALYMFYVLVFNAAPGWGDAASLFGFIVIALIGVLAGVSAEFVKYLIKPRQEQGADRD